MTGISASLTPDYREKAESNSIILHNYMGYTCRYIHFYLAGFRLIRQTQSYVMLSCSFLEIIIISVSCSTSPNPSYVWPVS